MEYVHLEYRSDNGYTGITYGKSSFVILDSKGRWVMHTGRRAFHTMEDLKKIVDGYPEFMKALERIE